MNKKKIENYLFRAIKYALFLTALTPIIVARKTISPFAMGKMFFFRTLVEIALALILILIALKGTVFFKGAREKIRRYLKNPLVITLSLFFISVVVSAIFAVNPYRAFWGDMERSEGVFGFAHYLAFFFLIFLIFKKTDWLNFLKIFLISSALIIFYGFLQYFKISSFPFAMPINSIRINSLIGNAAFLATFLIFTIIFSAIVWKKSGRVWRTIALILAPLSLVSIFLTGTRGAITGLGAGAVSLLIYCVIHPPSRVPRAVPAGLFALFLIGSGFFFITKSSPFWQSVPGLNRLAETTISRNDASTQTRLIVWQMSWKAFKEKPILGWGPDNFLVAANKHYNSKLGFYEGSTWLDRAHNKIFDMLVMQGGLGLFTYLGIFIAVFLVIIKEKQKFLLAVLSAGFIAYFVQNLFIFDQIVSHLPFFALLGYIASERKENTEKGEEKTDAIISESRTRKLPDIILASIAILAVLLIFYAWHTYTYTPYAQTRAVWEAKKISDKEGVEKELRMAFFPYNFAQLQIRGQAVDDYYGNQVEVFEKPFFNSLSDLLTESTFEVIKKEPYDARVFLRVAEIMNVKARSDPKLYETQEKIMRDALKIAPKRHELYYNLIVALGNEGKNEEAIETARKVVAIDPGIPRAHYYLAITLAIAGNEHIEEAMKEFREIETIDPNFKFFGELLKINDFAELFLDLNEIKKVAELALLDANGKTSDELQQKYHELALQIFAAGQEKDKFIKIAEVLAERSPNTKDDMEILIDLAKKGKWNIIQNLFNGN